MSESDSSHPEPWEKAADEVLDELADELGYSGFDGARIAVESMKTRWKAIGHQRGHDVQGSREPQRYAVECEECGRVSFDVTDADWFGNQAAATWYAGYHAGKEHPDADYQLGMVVEIEATEASQDG